MLDIWEEKIFKFKIRRFNNLYRSLNVLRFLPDGRFFSLDIAFSFLEYGVWQHYGTGREYSDNIRKDLKFLDPAYRHEHRLDEPRKVGPAWGGKYTSGFPREDRPWLSKPYYRSVMALRDFMADSLGHEFVGMFAALDDDDFRNSTYRATP